MSVCLKKVKGVYSIIWHHTLLPVIRHRWTCPNLTPAKQAGTWFTYPGGMEGWVDLGVGYILRWFTCLRTVTHLSNNHLRVTRLGIEPTIFWFWVQHPNDYATKPQCLPTGRLSTLCVDTFLPAICTVPVASGAATVKRGTGRSRGRPRGSGVGLRSRGPASIQRSLVAAEEAAATAAKTAAYAAYGYSFSGEGFVLHEHIIVYWWTFRDPFCICSTEAIKSVLHTSFATVVSLSL